ncbi:GNAT family N-acetyltransferase [Phytoactinopolyspora alkaliphila]|uniref:GNAT family N-acetyltransferase n=1 Tax=Phytoactinopolyspora alkaliphila TaxID=1783498 RepID=A0A6N9YLC1_9ACTN|nr:GNAT family N-acetyltransferase [Phytoactinopolyspora alkaliphila]NED95648.1 GNAT family N-acetyltransferase [Phytoactinopolyspora alkaliphila]
MIWTVRTRIGPLMLREQLEPEDEPGVLRLFQECDDWFEATTGGPSGPGDVQSLFYALPEGYSFEDKRIFTLRDGSRIVGLVDAVVGYPRPRACAVGAFLIAPSHRGRGVATAVAEILLSEAREAGFKEVTATTTDRWPAGDGFLRSLGFDLPGDRPTTDQPTARATLNLDRLA